MYTTRLLSYPYFRMRSIVSDGLKGVARRPVKHMSLSMVAQGGGRGSQDRPRLETDRPTDSPPGKFS
jgi:hypothetical protein